MEATGVLAAGETTAAMAYIKGRRGVSPRQMKLILLVCMLAIGIPVGGWVSGSWFAATISIEFAFVGVWVGLLAIQRLAGSSMRKALAKRGQAYEQPLSLRLTPEALVYDLGDLTMTANWRCVTDLFQTRNTGCFWFKAALWSFLGAFLQPPKPNTILLPRPCH